jgi:hypothetical protein
MTSVNKLCSYRHYFLDLDSFISRIVNLKKFIQLRMCWMFRVYIECEFYGIKKKGKSLSTFT